MSPVNPHTKSYAFFLFLILTLTFLEINYAQRQRSSTDPTEVVALNSIMKQWSKQWNFSGEPCHTRGIGIIGCNCSYNSGTTCHITEIDLGSEQVDGTLSEDIGALTYLESLDLNEQGFSGSLPISIGKLTNLQYLDLTLNLFSGSLPISIGKLTNLQYLWLRENDFTGTIPKELGNLTSLQTLSLEDNEFIGTIPEELGNLTSLQTLSLNMNAFTGTIPEVLGNLTSLQTLSLNMNAFTGTIPEVLGNLTSLQTLSLNMNAFTGTIPKVLGNLTSLQTLWISDNAFSGTIPKELGNLMSLQDLSLCPNNFSGTLPSELGNLVNLTFMIIPSCGDVGGQIPSTFANLINLQKMSMSDNLFTGTLPDFIGNWSKLTDLIIAGNSFEGPIPSSYANLVSLETLQISDLSNVSSSFDFITLNMTKLTTLIVRNAMMTGSLPNIIISGLRSLTFLDLSFNNLSGEIPDHSFWMSLKYVFLGSNNLSGSLPVRLYFYGLLYIDLSYNQLSGDLPDWLITLLENRQANIVANNFVFTEQNLSVSQQQYCLQRTFSCGTDTQLQTGFSIDCGGQGAKGNDNTIKFEADNSDTLGVLCDVSDKKNWAVSNVGRNVDNPKFNYLQNTNDTISNTTSPKLFQTSRSSGGSLRYYGLGMRNGPYAISLMFAEISIPNQSSKSYESFRRRVFDIYVQGVLKFKDFNIAKEAGGVDVAIEKKLIMNVTDNYLEIHLFWAGKGTSSYHDSTGIYGPSIAGISALLISDQTNHTLPPKPSTGFVAGISLATAFAILAFITVLIIYIKTKKSHADEDKDFTGLGATFTYSELRIATEDFSSTNKLGQGGFGPVYKGLLPDDRPIAVKQLSVSSHQGKSEFLAEIDIISTVRHQNLVRLYGCCIENNRQLLVYEYLEKKSLDQALFGSNDLHLDWPSRFKIILGTAKGLTYLHEDLTPRIVHRDIKASNILLDAELCPKISDFGLAKFFDAKDTHISTRIAGTTGYLAPEYAMFGHLTEKVDIFGFGVVILEILSGRPNTLTGCLGSKKQYLLEWAWNLYDEDRCLELMDPRLGEYNEEEAIRLVTIALWCTQSSPAVRPPMSRVVGMLLGDLEVNRVTTKPNYLTDMLFNELTSSSYNEGGASTSLLIEGR